MIIDIIVPSPGESITQVQLANWLVSEGEIVSRDQEVAEIDSDKATLSISAPEEGKITILAEAGAMATVGEVIARIDTAFKADIKESASPKPVATKLPEQQAEPKAEKQEQKDEPKKEPLSSSSGLSMTPLARKVLEESGTSQEQLSAFLSGKRISKSDAEGFIRQIQSTSPASFSRESERKKMSTLRLKLSERLVAVKNQTAMLTTFNEINMSEVMKLRKTYADAFQKKYGIKPGFMGFFTKAVAIALKHFPMINGMIEGDEIVLHDYCDIGIAVSAPKGLVVPVIRNAESLSLPDIELEIAALAGKARDSKLSIDEMTGGTFTITNGGVFGSLMSTPIINPPQSAILGMHAIQDRPVAINGQILIQPMMYVALSYDHRIIDGKESVSFLVMIKELIENPMRMLSQGQDPARLLFDL